MNSNFQNDRIFLSSYVDCIIALGKCVEFRIIDSIMSLNFPIHPINHCIHTSTKSFLKMYMYREQCMKTALLIWEEL